MELTLFSEHVWPAGLPEWGPPALLWRPVLLALAVVLALVVVVVRRWWWRSTVAAGRWVRIIPPRTVDPTQAGQVWELLAGLAHRARYGWWRPARPPMALEFHAAGRRVQAGLWLPGWVPLALVEAACAQAWPGAVVEPAESPSTPLTAARSVRGRWRVAGYRLRVTDPDAVWLAKPDLLTRSSASAEPLRAVWSSLASSERPVVVQVLARPAPARRVAALGRDARLPRWQQPRGAGRLAVDGLVWLLRLPVVLLAELLLGPAPATTSTTGGGSRVHRRRADPVETRRMRQAADKLAAHPELVVTIRVAAAANRRRVARSVARQTAEGFVLASHGLRPTRLHRAAVSVASRRAGRGHWLLATGAELGALARLPADPARYQMATTAIHRPPAADATRARPEYATAGISGWDQDGWTPPATGDGLDLFDTGPGSEPVDTGGVGAAADTPGRPARLPLVPPGSPRRRTPTPIGVTPGGGELIGLAPADARHHVHIVGPTGVGKSTLLVNVVLAQVRAGRGVVVFDPGRGDLIRDLLDRLPETAGRRLVLVDPDEKQAPAGLNLLALHSDPEAVTEQLVGVMARVWAQHWGPRLDDLARHAVLTLAHLPAATVADLPILLADASWRRQAMTTVTGRAEAAVAAGLARFWAGWDALSPAQQYIQGGPLLARLRAVLSRRFAAQLFGVTASTVDLGDILNGGVLLVRLPKGVLGEDTVRLVGSLLLAALLHTAAARAALPEPDRLDAMIVLDECHNLLHLPVGIDTALAEARGLNLSLVLAHQHLDQLTPAMAAAVDANARNKVLYAVSPSDAKQLVHHVAPYFTAEDLTHRDAHGVVCRLVAGGRDGEPFSLHTRPAPPAWPGRAETLRAEARARGLPHEVRRRLAETRQAGPAASGHRNRASSDDGHAAAVDTPVVVPHAPPVLPPASRHPRRPERRDEAA